ncbi:response regulator transcription factor [Phenylobacterium sp.]|uniref:response regulator transcription factor n=1 Tax=Phenylobacterium sp. TaxID=1871053 RepID=UPI002732082F|nr:response regulator transcription factor [Phenylobacterium sp.]MDP1616765.1 response regulator transcription factor [Phenylobacterium sp.]MDP1988289.1 response regulator transcription factor [Phenylobacterium sp.]
MRVAILEDDPAHGDLVEAALRSENHTCLRFTSGAPLLVRLRQETFDLLVLDWNVPGPSGLDVLAWARANLQAPPPVLMITARASAEDIVTALDAGADDFIVKPIERSILLARVNAVLRRAYPSGAALRQETFGEHQFDPMTETVSCAGEPKKLTTKEFALALAFFRNLNRPLGRAYLLETVWGRNPDLPTRTLDAHVSRIRAKLNLRPALGYRLAPVYSYGYRLEAISKAVEESSPP